MGGKMTTTSFFLVLTPLILSAFTHLFNPVGFPCLHADEAKYVRRALHILVGLGPQDPSSRFDHGQKSTSSYDHPHFGQIFLAGLFRIIGYPSSIDPSPTIQTIEMLYMVPRILMGMLAVVDTFLIYKIVERRYSTKTGAFIASTLFAVMPITWLMRRIYLDSILMPFVLSSILLAIYLKRNNDMIISDNVNGNVGNLKNSGIKNAFEKNRNMILTLISGILLGLAIYTKVPAITMIPLVGFVIFTNSKSFKTLGIWLIPVILVPLLWPAYALSVGEFDDWLDGVFWQATQRIETGMIKFIRAVIMMDPVLVVIGLIGIVFAAIRRDSLILLWVVPFFIFSYLIQWTLYFHFILILPVFCIATALLIVDISNKIMRKNEVYQKLLSFAIISAIGLFGLTSTVLIITTNAFSVQIAHVALAVQNIQSNDNNDDITIITAPEYSWIFKYIFNKTHAFQTRDSSGIRTDKILLMVDRSYLSVTSKNPLKNEYEDPKQVERLFNIYNSTHTIASLDYSDETPKNYPYTNLKDCPTENLQIKTNY
jgi:4-amino-4-deoxy-L-arabinose transferase-like glycosyltransferase